MYERDSELGPCAMAVPELRPGSEFLQTRPAVVALEPGLGGPRQRVRVAVCPPSPLLPLVFSAFFTGFPAAYLMNPLCLLAQGRGL